MGNSQSTLNVAMLSVSLYTPPILSSSLLTESISDSAGAFMNTLCFSILWLLPYSLLELSAVLLLHRFVFSAPTPCGVFNLAIRPSLCSTLRNPSG